MKNIIEEVIRILINIVVSFVVIPVVDLMVLATCIPFTIFLMLTGAESNRIKWIWEYCWAFTKFACTGIIARWYAPMRQAFVKRDVEFKELVKSNPFTN